MLIICLYLLRGFLSKQYTWFFAMGFQCSDAAADLVQLELRLLMPRRAVAEYCCLELAWLNRICIGLWVEFILTSWRLLQEILMIQVNPVFVSSLLAVSCHGGQVLCNFEYCHVCVIKPLDFLSVLYLVSFNRCKWNKWMFFKLIKDIFWKNEIIYQLYLVFCKFSSWFFKRFLETWIAHF